MKKHLGTIGLFFGVSTIVVLMFHWAEFMLGLHSSENVRALVGWTAVFCGFTAALFRAISLEGM